MQRTQVIVIGGGTTFDTYEAYCEHLRGRDVDLDAFRGGRDWKDNLRDQLGNGFDVLTPPMPNKMNARYQEWRIWFGRILAHADERVVLIGHSLGGLFLAKYCSQERLAVTVDALMLVAAPYEDTEHESVGEFTIPSSLQPLAHTVGRIDIFHSEDDPVVPVRHADKYAAALPGATLHRFNDRGHLKQASLPELEQLLRSRAA